MIVLGINSDWDNMHQNELKPGGACLLVDGLPMCGILEERLNRKKYSSGYMLSVKACLSAIGIKPDDIDVCVVSNCCDHAPNKRDLNLHSLNTGINRDKLASAPSHHLIHAASAFLASPFEEALIVVADDEGNMLSNRRYKRKYWLNRFERTSVFIGRGIDLRLERRYCNGWEEMGIGTVWRFFTRWLGFGPWYNAGKTMALAAYGDPKTFAQCNIFKITEDGRFTVMLENRPNDKTSAIREFFLEHGGINIGPARERDGPITDRERDIAAWLQRETENILVHLVQTNIDKTGLSNVCFAGGVALNCVALRAVADRTSAKEIFVQPSASDAGQCLGNALYGYHLMNRQDRVWRQNHTFLGPTYAQSEIKRAIMHHRRKIKYEYLGATFPSRVSKLIDKGLTVGWFQGGSELGPRALGNRSILADPRNPQMSRILNEKVKKREMFRPYAPAVLSSRANEYFDYVGESSFMAIAAYARPGVDRIIPSAVHVDRTARIQVVSPTVSPKFYKLLECFEHETGVPIVINTSFNVAGSPIVETPWDAIDCFLNCGLDVLCMGEYLVSKTE